MLLSSFIGCSLKEYVCPADYDPYPLPLDEALKWFRQLVQVLMVHQRQNDQTTASRRHDGIIHGDLKAENLMLRSEDANCLVVVDYGTARRVDGRTQQIPEVTL